jgi:hypothetical protein
MDYDPALDYQAGEARATSADRSGSEHQRELPAAVNASNAKALVQSMIARDWAERDRLTLRLPPSFLDLQPGARVDLNLSPRGWRVEQCTIDGFVVVAELRPSWNPGAAVSADAGRIVPNKDVVAADLTLALFDIPDVFGEGMSTPTTLLAASSSSSGWKSCIAEIVAGQQILQVQTAVRKTVLGRALTVLSQGDPYLINHAGMVDVELIDADQWLLNCDDDALVNGANLAVLGSELIQFGAVEPRGGGRFRLSKLLRGRGGTEWAMNSHTAAEAFALIQRDSLRSVPLPSWAVGTNVTASARNVSGTTSSSAPIVLNGESMRPRSPVALKVALDAAGNLALSWTRRTRAPSAWVDEVDVPLGERIELYRVTVTNAQESIELETDRPELQLSAEQLVALGSGPATIQVRQVGDAAVSRPAECNVII